MTAPTDEQVRELAEAKPVPPVACSCFHYAINGHVSHSPDCATVLAKRLEAVPALAREVLRLRAERAGFIAARDDASPWIWMGDSEASPP